jgi:hypothetical protein
MAQNHHPNHTKHNASRMKPYERFLLAVSLLALAAAVAVVLVVLL